MIKSVIFGLVLALFLILSAGVGAVLLMLPIV